MNEGLARKTRSLREIPEEVRRKNNIQKMKSSTEMVVAACAISKFLAEREMRTSSTGSVYYTEEYVDYNKFLSYLVEQLKELGSSWLPEGDLIFKCDEGISQASIRDTATRASLVNMSNLSPHIFNLMRDQRKESARFFGRMCEAFLEKRASSDVISILRKKLWEYGQCDSLFESINLGLNNKVQKKFDDKTSGNMIEEMGVLDLEEFKELFCEEFSKIKYFENVHIGHDIGIGKFHHTFIFCRIIPSIKDTVNDVICRLCHETKKFRVMFSCKKCRPKKAELLGQIHADGIISYSFGVYKKSPDDFKFFTDDKEQADMTIPNVIEAKKYVEECLDDIAESLSLKEDFSLGLSKKVKNKFDFDKANAVDNISDYIDLGLPSGTLWCKHNYGADENEYGDLYNHDDAKKLNLRPGILPSKEDFSELYDNCTHKWITIDETSGELFTSKINGNSVFFPAGGVESYTSHSRGNKGFYWASSSHIPEFPDTLFFDRNGTVHPSTCYHKNMKFSVRPIVKKSNESINLGLNNKVKKKFDKIDAIDNLEFEFVDLGLPSGNMWAKYNIGSSDVNDAGSLLNHSEAVDAAFENKLKLPTTEDFKELMKYCHIEWVHATYSNTSISGLELTSLHNGNKIFFPAGGHYDNKYNTQVENLNKFCYYWTQTKSDSKMLGEYFMSLIFGSSFIKDNLDGYQFWHSKSSDTLSVRLISKKRLRH